MRHIHFGAGHFGLGFVVWLFWKAKIPTILLNRVSKEVETAPPDSVSKSRRNELLARKKYAVSYETTDNGAELFDSVTFENFIEYEPTDLRLASLNKYFLQNEPLCVTFSFGQVDAYSAPVAQIRSAMQGRLELGIKAPVYLMALENRFSTDSIYSHYFAHDDGEFRTLVPLNVCVDRICSMLNEYGTQSALLEVATERYASIIIENKAGVDELKNALRNVTDVVQFSDWIEVERNKKRWIVNGSHALIALTSEFYGITSLTDFYSVDGLPAPYDRPTRIPPSKDLRLAFAKGIIDEMTEGFRCATAKTEFGRQYLDAHGNNLAIFANGTHQRFANTFDTTSRVIKNFVAPRIEYNSETQKIKLVNTISEFVGWTRPRLEEPVRCYIDKHGSAPKNVVAALLNMLEMIGQGDFLKQVSVVQK